MDQVAALIAAFEGQGSPGHAAWKLDLLLDLGQYDDVRVLALYARVAADPVQPVAVRSDALRRLREAPGDLSSEADVVEVCAAVLRERAPLPLRLHAALALGDFARASAAQAALGAVAANATEPLELRYTAFTSLQRAGPQPAVIALLQALAADDVLGSSARAVLTSWDAT